MNDNYTKMCEKANLPWEQKVGDIIYGIGQQKDYIYVSKPVNTKAFPDSYYVIPPRGGCHLYRFPAGVIFKPSIEQLMEMVEPVFWKVVNTYPQALDEMYDAFSVFIFEGKTSKQWPYNHGVTNQELWLAFVMRELFSKRWSGSEWEKV